MEMIRVHPTERCGMVEITRRLQEVVEKSTVQEGVLFAQSLHTTAGLTINENADPDVVHDLVAKTGALIPREESYYRHAEGNSDSHLKTSMYGPTLSVLVSEGQLVLGRWQGVYLCEWDGPRDRQVAVTIVKS
jgi:secondary thiamine-phosphate synthase enzyme